MSRENFEPDVIIVGTGMGAGASGYVLAKAGLRVLFLESGLPKSRWKTHYAGNYPEAFVEGSNRNEVFSHSGRATFKVNDWTPVLGAGAGGGTAVYGAALFPFHPQDLEHWPEFTFKDLESYYQKCDELFRSNGTVDPLFPHPRKLVADRKFPPWAQELFDFYNRQGLHPFQTPIGFENYDGCQQCFGFFCPKDCKKTSFNVFIEPFLKTGQAHVEYSTTVQQLATDGQNITGVICQTLEGKKEFRAKWYFLAAGALMTPTILLQSKSDSFPRGIGNQNDLVGRHLMRHLIDFYYVKTPSSKTASGHLIEVSISDFYHHNGINWGLLNSAPGLMSPKIIASDFVEKLKTKIPIPAPWFILKNLLTVGLEQITKDRVLVTSILEDSPDSENRILPQSNLDQVSIHYKITAKDKARLQDSRHHLKKIFKPLSGRLLKVAEDSSFLAHACGTCRMAKYPKEGVVAPNGNVFSTENLYITDASIFPTSGGANPSLTTAACAMKIAEQFVREKWKI